MPSVISRFLLALLAVALVPTPALADWRRAETTHFVVYSNGSERGLRDYAVKLERFDALLRILNAGMEPPTGVRKLPVYLVDNRRELQTIQPGLADSVAGFYRASPRDIRAVLVRGESDDVLLHEYVHHFMSHNSPGSYPGWFREGYAEYFMTATVDGRGNATFGFPNMGRLRTLQQQRWMPLEQLLSATPNALERRGQRWSFYAQSWLLTHYLLSDPDRMRGLNAYLLARRRPGADPVTTLTDALGTTPEALTRDLRSYMGRLRYAELTVPALDPAVEVTRLPDSADDLMLVGLDVLDGAPDDKGPELLSQVRSAASRHPDDPFAQTVLGQAEIAWGDAAAGDAALAAALTTDPDWVEALLASAHRHISAGDEMDDPAARITRYRQAQELLARAHRADPTDYRVLGTLARIRKSAEDYPTPNDLETLRTAVFHAPQVTYLRGEAADAMIAVGEDAEALYYLLPIANDPHGGALAERAQERIDAILARRASAASASGTAQPSD